MSDGVAARRLAAIPPAALERTGLLDEIGHDHVYPRVSDAVDAYSAEDTVPASSR